MKNGIRQRIAGLLEDYPVWTRRTVAEHFDRAAEKYADRIFICTPGQEYTYAQIQKKSRLMARGLLALGIRPREHVAMMMGNYPEFIIFKLALARIGAVAVPLNTMLLEREIAFLLEDSDAVAVAFNDRLGRLDFVKIMTGLCSETNDESTAGRRPRYARFPEMRHLICFSPAGNSYPGMVDFNDLFDQGASVAEKELEEVQRANAYPDDIFDLMYTSGTTALPKGAMLSHDMSLRNVYAFCLTRAIENGRRLYSPLPFYHIFAWNYMIMVATFIGGMVITHSQFVPSQALELMEKYKANELICVPSLLLAIVNYPEIEKYDLSSLQSVFCAAASAPLPLWKKAKEILRLEEVATGYGLTEAGGAISLSYPDDSEELAASRVGRMMLPNCSGLPEFGGGNHQCKVIDPDTGEELPPGKAGELACRGNVVARGYYKRPQINDELIDKDGWLRTGDLVIIHPDGLFEFTGRSKEIYKTSGENVIPREIEDVLSTHPKVNQAYLVGIPHPVMGEVGAALIELKAGETATRREIINYCKENMAKFKVPRYVFFVSAQELPFTATGKVQKYKLVEYVRQLLKESGQAEPDS